MARTAEELWAVLEHLDDDLLDADMPQEVVDEALAAAGLDPAHVDVWAKELAEKIATMKGSEGA